MKINVPFVGTIKTGKDADSEPSATVFSEKETNKFLGVLGGMFDLSKRGLSNEKTVSTALLEANKDWVYRNNDVIAQEVSSIEFELYSVGLSKGEITFTQIQEHALLTLLDKFNATTTKQDGMYTTQSHKKITGDAFWQLVKNGREISDIMILQPDKVTLELGDPTRGEPLVTGYIYRDVIDGKQIKVLYKPDEIVHFKKPNPSNQFRGLGAVEAIADTIDTDNLVNMTQKNFFKNGAITNFILSTESKVGEDQLKRLKADFKANNQGAWNAFKLMVLGGGLKPVNISYSNRDLMLKDLLEWYRDKIMVGFGNTPAAIGIIEDVNQSNANDTLASWKRTTVKPDMDAIVNTLNEFLLPLFGKNLVLGYVNIVPEDRTDDLNESVQLKQAGIITINEAREKLGYETIDGGDTFAPTGAVPNPDENPDGNKPAKPTDENELDDEAKRIYKKSGRDLRGLGNVPASLRHLDVKQILRKRKLFTLQKYNRDLKESVKPVVAKIIADKKLSAKQKEAAIDEATDERISPYFENKTIMEFYEKQIGTVEAIEAAFDKALIGLMTSMEKQALDAFDHQTSGTSKAKLKRFIKKEQMTLFDDEAIKTQAQVDLVPLLANQIVLSGQAAYELLDLDSVYIPYDITRAVQNNVLKFTQSMLDTDRERLNGIIADGIENGQSVPDIRNLIAATFDESITKKQAQVITRTEVLRASNMGNLDAFKQSGVVEAKQWLTAGATDVCEEYEGKTEGLDGNFYSSDNQFQDGNPPLHPNCRCVLIPVVKTEE